MFLLESPHRGNSNECTQNTIFNMDTKNTLNYPKSAYMLLSKGLKNQFKTAVVNEPSVFEPLKFHGIRILAKEVLQIFCSQCCFYTKCLCPKKGSNSTEKLQNKFKSQSVHLHLGL